ncbi:transcription termination factor NusA [Bdellovibrio bacteriovorus]|uniref:Transcription termination/antitermination protein NusA n=1 Tax=Bdellovibrio bacteriovorus (strain ATCC 15356 / DSM 50701 / NCIMB 9529 / HD100) TaxID=264462 RepID=Q6MMS7_BDEBA|nr:transcription termination factor NusA [Bdellovibrio bacteriovorus]AHZ84097.1 transcription elongation factor NusA [Bdellovibrio bacteriovorus]BEV67980.1 Transcription termination/antitermination protein NusA [Bdellovibrio bacteriovorus]CAE79426.1 N utilization substance protein A [Bdellovibrio bacteriovorus HD100]
MAENVFSDLSKVIDQVGKDKGIDKQVVIDAITQGMLVAARKKYGTYREIEAAYNEDTGEVELFEFKEVVPREKYIDEEVEIPLDEAQKLDPNVQLDDSIGIKMEASDLGRIAAQTAKQIIMQKVRDAERNIIFNEFEERKGEIASGIARRVEKGAIVVDLGRTEAYIPPREQIPGEQYKPGDRIQGYLSEVRQTTRGPQIIMSRADERYLMKLFEMEVPEIYDGVVEIMAAAREPGQRAKIAVRSKDNSVDPVGACVGMKGSRVQNIVQELRGEKIDIVPWDEDITRFACNALAPAEISRVFLDDANREMEIVVPDSQLSLAIGKRGQNVRLAAKLTTWKLDIISESSAASRTAESIFNLMLIPGMSETMAQNIFQSGFGSFQAVATAAVEELMTIPGYDDPDKAEKLSKEAKGLVAKYESEGVPVPTAPSVAKDKGSNVSAKEQADLLLKQELKKLEAEEE